MQPSEVTASTSSSASNSWHSAPSSSSGCQAPVDVSHDREELRVEVPQEGRGHDAEDARVDVAGAGAEQEAGGGVQLAGEFHDGVGGWRVRGSQLLHPLLHEGADGLELRVAGAAD